MTSRRKFTLLAAALLLAAPVVAAPVANAQDGPAPATDLQQLVDETIDLYGIVAFLEARPKAMALAVVSGDANAVRGFGETADGSGVAPDGRSIFGVGSLSKVFSGNVLAAATAAGMVALTDPLAEHVPGIVQPERDGTTVRLIDLVTHSAGFPRELPSAAEPEERGTEADVPAGPTAAELAATPLLFRPGSSIAYSNVGFQLLGAALGNAYGGTYPEALASLVTGPLGMADTGPRLDEEQRSRLMTSYDFDGSPLPFKQLSDIGAASGGLFTTADDMVRWMQWHLGTHGSEAQLLSHAMVRQRSQFANVIAMDESTPMDAMALGWVATMPSGDKPFILQKAGARNGFMAYVALAPARRTGVFIVINEFDFAKDRTITSLANDILATLPDASR